MHQTLLLVTPVLRFNNLKHILANIKNVFKDEEAIMPLWILCIDKFNCVWNNNDIECLVEECNESGIRIAVYYQGDDNGPNYGGALMNAPLEDLKNNYFKHENPLFTGGKPDDLIKHHNKPEFYEKGKAIYEKRKAENWKNLYFVIWNTVHTCED